jgi:hypothetical protein
MRRKLVLWFVLLIAGFLTGFILQYASLRRTQQQLCVSAEQLRSCRSREEDKFVDDPGHDGAWLFSNSRTTETELRYSSGL